MISSTAKYALRAVVYMAGQPDRFVNRAEISDATLVPHEYLLKVLNLLDAAKLVESRRGPGGGYRLLKPADELTSLEVVLAVESIPRITECPLGIVEHEKLCPLHQLLDEAGRRVEEAFAAAKISDLLPRKRSRTCDFPKKIANTATEQTSLTWSRTLITVALLSVAIVSVSAAMKSDSGKENKAGDDPKVLETSATQATRFAVTIRKPAGPPRVTTGLNDAHGSAMTVACSTCHTTRQPNHENKTVKDLDEFHGGMAFSHGTVSCLSCHNSNDYDALKLADGSRIEFTDVMTLCGQCHGPQLKDYKHGAHGGMNGHWDLTRGPQVKNNCVDCHNPHSPQFPKMQPTFKPRDRFLEQPGTEH